MDIMQQVSAQRIAEKITFEEFLTRYDGVYAEWLGGEVVVYPMGNNAQHQAILVFLTVLLYHFLGMHKIGQVLLAGIVMKVSEEAPAREPDLMVLLNAHADQLKPTYLQAPADIVIEIVSPESSERDRGQKFVEYEVAKVPEYWLIDPLRKEANIYVLNADGHYRRVELDAQDRLVSMVLQGFKIEPSILWQSKLPESSAIMPMIEAMGK